MKLVRLTTQANDVSFNSYFNESITIKKYSKVALANLSIESKISPIVINGANNQITYNLRKSTGADDKVVNLDISGSGIIPPEYNGSNYQLLLNDIKTKCNSVLAYNAGKELGCQWSSYVNDDNKVVIEVKQSKFGSRTDQLDKNINLIGGVPSLTRTGKNWKAYAARAASDDFLCNTSLIYPITKGAGTFQVKINKLEDNGGMDDDTQGFIIGLLEQPVSEYSNLSLSDIKYGIQAMHPENPITVNGPGYYRYIIDGMVTISPVQISADTMDAENNDHIGFVVSQGSVSANIYQQTTNNTEAIFTESYNNIDNLYPVIIIKTNTVSCQLTEPKFTTDPYLDLNPSVDDSTELNILTVPQPTGAGLTVPSNMFLLFNSSSVPAFLQYNYSRQPIDGFIKAVSHSFTADNIFTASAASDSFLVLLDNIQLNSYDDYDKNGYNQGGRQNILKVIPQSDANSTIIYEPNNLDFIDINNANDLIIRNFKASVVKNDYSKIISFGLSTLTLLFKESDE